MKNIISLVNRSGSITVSFLKHVPILNRSMPSKLFVDNRLNLTSVTKNKALSIPPVLVSQR